MAASPKMDYATGELDVCENLEIVLGYLVSASYTRRWQRLNLRLGAKSNSGDRSKIDCLLLTQDGSRCDRCVLSIRVHGNWASSSKTSAGKDPPVIPQQALGNRRLARGGGERDVRASEARAPRPDSCSPAPFTHRRRGLASTSGNGSTGCYCNTRLQDPR